MSGLFRTLTPKERRAFRRWARHKDNYRAGDPINPLWHPIVRRECEKVNREAGLR